MIIEIIGKFFDNHSLSIINRNLAIGLAAKNDVYITPLDGFTPDAKLDKEIVKKLKTIMSKKWGKKEADLQIRHSYPQSGVGRLAQKLKSYIFNHGSTLNNY